MGRIDYFKAFLPNIVVQIKCSFLNEFENNELLSMIKITKKWFLLQRIKKCLKNSLKEPQNNTLIIFPKGFKLQKPNFLFGYPQCQNFNFNY